MIGERILQILEEAELSVEGLSAVCGIHEEQLWDIVSGAKRPRRGTLRKIAEALGTDMASICGTGGTECSMVKYPALDRRELGNTFDVIREYMRADTSFAYC